MISYVDDMLFAWWQYAQHSGDENDSIIDKLKNSSFSVHFLLHIGLKPVTGNQDPNYFSLEFNGNLIRLACFQ